MTEQPCFIRWRFFPVESWSRLTAWICLPSSLHLSIE